MSHSLNMEGTAKQQQEHNNDCQTNKTEHWLLKFAEMVGQSICQKHKDELDLWKPTCFFCACQEDELFPKLMQVFLKKKTTPSVEKDGERRHSEDKEPSTSQDGVERPSEDKQHSTTSASEVIIMQNLSLGQKRSLPNEDEGEVQSTATTSASEVLGEPNLSPGQKRSRPNEDDGVVHSTATTPASEGDQIALDGVERPSEDKQHSTTSASEDIIMQNLSLGQKRSRPNEDDGVTQSDTTTSASEEPWELVNFTDGDEMQHSTTSTSEGGGMLWNLTKDFFSGLWSTFEDMARGPASLIMPSKKTYYTLIPGKSAELSQVIETWLKPLTKEKSAQGCDIILATCMVVSRVGTDVEAALKDIPEDKPTILVVLHHTFDPDHVVPDSSRFAKRDDMLILDCLFNEDNGLLRCDRNGIAQSTMLEWINAKVTCSKVSRGVRN